MVEFGSSSADGLPVLDEPIVRDALAGHPEEIASPASTVEHTVSNQGEADVAVAGLAQSRVMTITRTIAANLGIDRDDLGQEVLIKALRQARSGTLQCGPEIGGWVWRVSTMTAIDLLRKAKARPQETSFEVPTHGRSYEPPISDAGFTAVENVAVIDQILSCLSPEHREVVKLVYLGNVTVPEAARILGIPTGTAKNRLDYGIKRARVQAQRLGLNDEMLS